MQRNLKLLSSALGLLALAGPARADLAAGEVLRLANAAATRVTSCPATADDLGAEATLRFLAATGGVPADRPAREAYLRRLVVNLRRDWLRKEGRVQALDGIDSSPAEGLDRRSGLEDPVEAAEVAEFVAHLKPEEREVLESMKEGLTEREIAREVGSTRHSVRTIVQRIRSRASEFFGMPEG